MCLCVCIYWYRYFERFKHPELYDTNGLNSVQYGLLDYQVYRLYIWMSIDVPPTSGNASWKPRTRIQHGADNARNKMETTGGKT